jgi:SAM-dependent methyltransferase
MTPRQLTCALNRRGGRARRDEGKGDGRQVAGHEPNRALVQLTEIRSHEELLTEQCVDPQRRTLVQTTYDDLAAEYAARLAGELAGKPLDRALLDRFAEKVRGIGPVYELGCGPGHVARYLHERGVDVSGIDLSPAMVEQAQRLHPDIAFRRGDMLALDVPEGALAGVVSFYAIVHLAPEALPEAFGEIRRVLRPEGTVLLAFHVGEGSVRPGELWGIPTALDWIFFRTEEVIKSLGAAGLVVTEAIERDPYEGVEHPSRRAYVFARAP